jgi:hypothetical protein
MDKSEEFSYCVGRPWPNSKSICVYAYGAQVQSGTMKTAEKFLNYVNEQTGEENFIYKLVKVEEEKK